MACFITERQWAGVDPSQRMEVWGVTPHVVKKRFIKSTSLPPSVPIRALLFKRHLCQLTPPYKRRNYEISCLHRLQQMMWDLMSLDAIGLADGFHPPCEDHANGWFSTLCHVRRCQTALMFTSVWDTLKSRFKWIVFVKRVEFLLP